jgi:tripeptidyl-peptidase-1
MAQEHPAAFTDITVGDNICTENGCSPSCTGFLATRGWDPVTGLGTPVYPEIMKYVMAMFP